MAESVTTEPKYRGLISRAVEEKQSKIEDEKPALDVEAQKDKDIKIDDKGQEYVQATMKFDDDFEIMEF